MYINAHDILGQDEGATASFEIVDERPRLTDLQLTGGLNGEVRLTRTSFGLLASGQISGSLRLQCHRCLVDYDQPVNASLVGEYVPVPDPEQWPIAADGQIDLAPLVRQELILKVPIKTLCRADCPGLCEVCGQVQDQPHRHPEAAHPKNNIRIVKGKLNHGSS